MNSQSKHITETSELQHRIQNNLNNMVGLLRMSSYDGWDADKKDRLCELLVKIGKSYHGAYEQSKNLPTEVTPKTIQSIDQNYRRLLEVLSTSEDIHPNFRGVAKTFGYFHETLQNTDTQNVYMDQLLTKISGFARKLYGLNVDVQASDTQLPTKTARHLGLIVNELFTNSSKYGGKSVQLYFVQDGDNCKLSYKDNGDGFPDLNMSLSVIEGLVKGIYGELIKKNDNGAQVDITFNYLENTP